jgi:hypothetical protein
MCLRTKDIHLLLLDQMSLSLLLSSASLFPLASSLRKAGAMDTQRLANARRRSRTLFPVIELTLGRQRTPQIN